MHGKFEAYSSKVDVEEQSDAGVSMRKRYKRGLVAWDCRRTLEKPKPDSTQALCANKRYGTL